MACATAGDPLGGVNPVLASSRFKTSRPCSARLTSRSIMIFMNADIIASICSTSRLPAWAVPACAGLGEVVVPVLRFLVDPDVIERVVDRRRLAQRRPTGRRTAAVAHEAWLRCG